MNYQTDFQVILCALILYIPLFAMEMQHSNLSPFAHACLQIARENQTIVDQITSPANKDRLPCCVTKTITRKGVYVSHLYEPWLKTFSENDSVVYKKFLNATAFSYDISFEKQPILMLAVSYTLEGPSDQSLLTIKSRHPLIYTSEKEKKDYVKFEDENRSFLSNEKLFIPIAIPNISQAEDFVKALAHSHRIASCAMRCRCVQLTDRIFFQATPSISFKEITNAEEVNLFPHQNNTTPSHNLYRNFSQ